MHDASSLKLYRHVSNENRRNRVIGCRESKIRPAKCITRYERPLGYFITRSVFIAVHTHTHGVYVLNHVIIIVARDSNLGDDDGFGAASTAQYTPAAYDVEFLIRFYDRSAVHAITLNCNL